MTEPIPVTGTISGRFTIDLIDEDDQYVEYELDLTTADGVAIGIDGIRMPRLRSWSHLPGTSLRRRSRLVEGNERIELSGAGVVDLGGDERPVAVDRLDFAAGDDPGTVALQVDLVDRDDDRPVLRLAGPARLGAVQVAEDELAEAGRLLDLAAFRREAGDGVVLLYPAL